VKALDRVSCSLLPDATMCPACIVLLRSKWLQCNIELVANSWHQRSASQLAVELAGRAYNVKHAHDHVLQQPGRIMFMTHCSFTCMLLYTLVAAMSFCDIQHSSSQLKGKTLHARSRASCMPI
jgi:hypothetical protein